MAQPVNATNIDLRVLRYTMEEDKWYHNAKIMAATRDVAFDWCRGVVTGADDWGTTRSTYRMLTSLRMRICSHAGTICSCNMRPNPWMPQQLLHWSWSRYRP